MQVCGGVPNQSYNTDTGFYEWNCTGGVLDETVSTGENEPDLDVDAGGLVLFYDAN